ncbi:transcriptional regulator [Marinobacterium zhoushanense]|uniref:Transcriptional regulator n=1 Tax=Marinobacterium zhoushanense TaxID=1679163 RepID=A0ABQ1KVL1_9GAMM|nr:helix-turn-helix transcriptional regulator [Marinobacterium zhoushanense]GGC08945.1 transcriptional regulator [Marinobacterium zhoushanense]
MDESTTLTAFGQHLRKLRLVADYSQEQLALSAGLDRTYISGIERGKRNPSLINLLKIASALNKTPSELLNFKEDDVL